MQALNSAGAQVLEVAFHKPMPQTSPAIACHDIDMEVGGIKIQRRGPVASEQKGSDHPANIAPGFASDAVTSPQRAAEDGGDDLTIEDSVVASGVGTAEKVADNCVADGGDKGGSGFNIGIVAAKKIGKKCRIVKVRRNAVPAVTGFPADPSYRFPVMGRHFSNRYRHHLLFMTGAG